MVAFDLGLLDRAVHALDLAIAPWVVGFVSRCSIPFILLIMSNRIGLEYTVLRLQGCLGERDAPRHCLLDQWRSNGLIG
jgi:hypothetical protein